MFNSHMNNSYFEIHFILLITHLVEEFTRMLDPVPHTLLHGLDEPKFVSTFKILPGMFEPDLGYCRLEKGGNGNHYIIPR